MPSKKSQPASRKASSSGRRTNTSKTPKTSRNKGAAGSRRRTAGHSAHPLTDHEQIRAWAEERGAAPSCVKRTGGRGDTGVIRLDFPGYSGEDSLQKISWDKWFEKFDESGLALMVQDTTAGGETSNFNKLVKRTTVGRRPRTRSAGR